MTAESQNNQQQFDSNSRLQEWLSRNRSETGTAGLIKRLPANERAPLSYGQLRLWVLQQMNPGNAFYHYAEKYTIEGDLDKERLINCFKEIVANHDVLRTTFQESEGRPWQQINEVLDPEILELDLSAFSETEKIDKVEEITMQEATRPFDLINGPLLRLGLFQIDQQHFQLTLVMHHIIADQWSMNVIRQQWASLYRYQTPVPNNEYRYVDFAFDQRHQVINKVNRQYWLDKLSGDLPQLEFPLSKRNNATDDSYKGSYHQWNFSSDTTKNLKRLSKETGTTMFVLLLSIFKVLLFRYTHESDISVATPVSNRNHSRLENMVGFFNETMILRDHLLNDMTFSDLVNTVQTTVLEGFAHKDIPFESIVKALKPHRLMSTNPLFQVMFLYNELSDTPSLGAELEWKYQSLDIGVSKFDLTLHIQEDHNQLSAILEYAHHVFTPDAIQKMQGHFDTLITGITKDINQPIAKLPLLTEEERSTISTKWNHNISQSIDYSSITDFLESTILKYPDKSAVVSDKMSITYAELGQLADCYSYMLAAKGIGVDSKVGVCTEKSGVEMIIGILAILKAGAAYVPMDAEYPHARLEYMIADAEIDIVLTQEHLVDRLSAFGIDAIPINTNTNDPSATRHPKPDIQESSFAYIMYTSGSTGLPKGVKITHGNLLSSTLSRASYYPDQPASFLLMSSYGFDSSVAGIFWTLGSGGTLILPPDRIEQDLSALSDLIERNQITHTLLLPSLYNLLLQHGTIEKLNSLNTVIVAGESCSAKTCENHFIKMPQTNLYNEYGPTEATVWSSVHKIESRDSEGIVPIGKPIENSRMYLLDQNLALVPAGVVAEIYICGKGTSPGYLNRPELTKAHFVSSPFPEDNGQIMYKTGDLGRYREDGLIQFMGRADKQIKLRGFRVEPGEINNVLMKFPGIKESAVALRQTTETVTSNKSVSAEEMIEILEQMDTSQAEKLLRSVDFVDQFNF